MTRIHNSCRQAARCLDIAGFVLRLCVSSGLCALLALGFAAPSYADGVASPAIAGPIAATAAPGHPSHNYPFFASDHDLAMHGYLEEEFLISGKANRYDIPKLATGKVIDGGHAYATRIVVRRPLDPKRFNGTVLVEWLNVTNGFDAENVWFFAWQHILRSGYAWVGVSAQRIGVDRLKSWNADRYRALDVTQRGEISDDALAYDIYAQVAQAIRHPVENNVLHGLKPRLVIATGDSQSANRLSSYINSVDPITKEYDAFLLLSSIGNAIRSDLRVPVWKISTEFDVESIEAPVRQPDTSKFRAWEIAGTSHVDQHLRASREPLELRDLGKSSEAEMAPTCAVPTVGTRVPTSDVVGAAYDLLVRWVVKGAQPPSAPKIEMRTIGAPGSPSVAARDSLGLARGGIRLSQVAVPTGLNIGTGIGPGACVRWGSYQAFDIAKLNAMYATPAAYLAKVTAVTRENQRRGYLKAIDADRTIAEATRYAGGTRH